MTLSHWLAALVGGFFGAMANDWRHRHREPVWGNRWGDPDHHMACPDEVER